MIQEVANAPLHKIPKLSQTRWLSRENVISVILEQYSALHLYFQTEVKTDKVDGASEIYRILSDRGTKPMLYFLQYILQKVNCLNIEFQSEHFRLHVLHSMVANEYRNILGFFIRDEVLQVAKLSEIDPNVQSNHKRINEIYLGGKASAHLIAEPFKEEVDKRFKSDCLKFLIELSNQFRNRFCFDEDSVTAKLAVLDPKKNQQFLPQSLIPLAVRFPSIVSENNLNDLDDQWRNYRSNVKEFQIQAHSIPNYWYQLRDLKDGLGNAKFKVLSDFMTTLTVLPHSSAAVELVFSLMNHVKTKQTNSLNAETVRDRVLAKQSITRGNKDCRSWIPNKTLVKDLESGAVSQRYLQRVKNQHKSLNIEADDCEDME